MFFEDMRSERLLMRQVADRLSVRWYVGYGLDELLPDHSTLSTIRQPVWSGGLSPLLRCHPGAMPTGEAGLGQRVVLRLDASQCERN